MPTSARTYIVRATGMGTGTALWINPGTTASLEILRVSATIGTVAGFFPDAPTLSSDMQRIQLVTQVSTFPTLTAYTPLAANVADPASAITGATTGAAGTCGVLAGAEGAGAKTALYSGAFQAGLGFHWIPQPEERIVLPAGSSSGFGVFFPEALDSSRYGIHAWLSYREF